MMGRDQESPEKMMYDEKSNDSRDTIQKCLTGTKWMVVRAFSMILDLKEWFKIPGLRLKITIDFGSRLFIYYVIHFEPPRGRLKDDYRMT